MLKNLPMDTEDGLRLLDHLEPHEIDALAETGIAESSFLRGAWFAAGAASAEQIIGLRDERRRPLVALPLIIEHYEPIPVRMIAGGCPAEAQP